MKPLILTILLRKHIAQIEKLKKRSAQNVYKIFSMEGLGRDKIQQIRSFSASLVHSNDIQILTRDL